MKYKAIIFDLDGTLTNTLTDLTASTNFALRYMGWSERTMEEVRHFVGNGVRRLMEQAVPENTSASDFEECFKAFQEHYVAHCQDNTDLYPGVRVMLEALKEKGYKLAIVSNKLQAGVTQLQNIFFKDLIDVAIGERKGVRRKPCPDMVELAMQELGVTADEAVYIGDSEVDIATARNSGLPCITVLWGFRERDYLQAAGASCMVECPAEILELV